MKNDTKYNFINMQYKNVIKKTPIQKKTNVVFRKMSEIGCLYGGNWLRKIQHTII